MRLLAEVRRFVTVVKAEGEFTSFRRKFVSKDRTLVSAGLLNKFIKSNSEDGGGFSGWVWAVLGFQVF